MWDHSVQQVQILYRVRDFVSDKLVLDLCDGKILQKLPNYNTEAPRTCLRMFLVAVNSDIENRELRCCMLWFSLFIITSLKGTYPWVLLHLKLISITGVHDITGRNLSWPLYIWLSKTISPSFDCVLRSRLNISSEIQGAGEESLTWPIYAGKLERILTNMSKFRFHAGSGARYMIGFPGFAVAMASLVEKCKARFETRQNEETRAKQGVDVDYTNVNVVALLQSSQETRDQATGSIGNSERRMESLPQNGYNLLPLYMTDSFRGRSQHWSASQAVPRSTTNDISDLPNDHGPDDTEVNEVLCREAARLQVSDDDEVDFILDEVVRHCTRASTDVSVADLAKWIYERTLFLKLLGIERW